MRAWRLLALLFGVLTAVGAVAAAEARWYSADQAQRGRAIYAENCATCHGSGGEGQPNWEQRDEMGYYPAPPLNADGHAWHHPLAEMLNTLDTGGGPFGGTMPSFIDMLDDAGKRAVLAYIQSLWPDKIYRDWAAIDRGEAKPPPMPQHDH